MRLDKVGGYEDITSLQHHFEPNNIRSSTSSIILIWDDDLAESHGEQIGPP